MQGRGGCAAPRLSVTFVFTDIEGSTRLLRRMGDEYRGRARAAPERASGGMGRGRWRGSKHRGRRVFRGVRFTNWSARGMCVRANGTRSCIVARRGRTSRPHGCAHRDRLSPRRRLHRPRRSAARVVHAAHGGQILASEHTVHALEDSPLPEEVTVSNLGRYRLRDFDGPVALFQVGGQHVDFPSVRAVPADRHNIVADRTLFVGRQTEVDDLTARLRPGLAVTLVATGGVGKTWLAMEVGLRVAPEWPDGVWMVDLSTVTAGPLVAPTIAETLGIAAAGSIDTQMCSSISEVSPRCLSSTIASRSSSSAQGFSRCVEAVPLDGRVGDESRAARPGGGGCLPAGAATSR